jgi:hypothetical protein
MKRIEDAPCGCPRYQIGSENHPSRMFGGHQEDCKAKRKVVKKRKK